MYAPRPDGEESLPRRAARLADAWLPLSRRMSFVEEHTPGHPVNVPASRFLRPWSHRVRFAEPLRVRRIVTEMQEAAAAGRSYHLWWHPHNFGRNLDKNLATLSAILRAFDVLRDRGQMTSKTMADFAAPAGRSPETAPHLHERF